MAATHLNLVLLITVALCGCTGNPFGDETIAPAKRQIRGEVQLLAEANLSPENVYVWLEGFNLGTHTGESGRFQLTLPPPASQNVSGGVTGFFNLHYYVANFDLGFTEVSVQNGEFILPKGELNQKGELHHPKKLLQFLSIETSVSPSELSYAELDSAAAVIKVRFTLQALDDTVTVFFPTEVGVLNAPVVFKNNVTGKFSVLESIPGLNEIRTRHVLGRTVRPKREVFVVLTPQILPPGDYEIIPFLLPQHEVIAEELMASLGEDVTALGEEYLNLPMKRQGGNFELR